MCGSKDEAIKKFKNDKQSSFKCLLVDLDKDPSHREVDIKENTLTNHSDLAFYMIQKMEAWFISQPDILENKWKSDCFYGFKKNNPQTIKDPDEELKTILKRNLNKKYNKVNDAVDLLMTLKPEELKNEFEDFNHLVQLIRKEL